MGRARFFFASPPIVALTWLRNDKLPRERFSEKACRTGPHKKLNADRPESSGAGFASWSAVMLLGRNSAKWMVRGAAAALALTAAHPALAQSATITAYFRDPALVGYVYPGPANAVFTIPVTASVGGTCGFSTAPNANLFHANIDSTGWSDQVPFTVECTAPWKIAVSSQNGALKNTGTAAVGYQNKAPYTVSLNVSSDGGTVSAACPVAEIDQAVGSSPCAFKGTASPTTGLTIPRSFGLSGSYIQVAASAYPGPDLLIPGNYNDTLVVTISPAS